MGGAARSGMGGARGRSGRPRGARRRLEVLPLTPDRWTDFEKLFGPRGAVGGCWCMHPRLTRPEYERMKGEQNRRAMKRIVDSGEEPGVLGYLDDEPVGWCALAPRSSFVRLASSRILKPIDDRPVWSIVCLFVAREHRNRGVSVQLIRGAVEYARARGARIVEAYPVIPKKNPMPPVFACTGIASAYLEAGFREVARRSDARPILRRALRAPAH